MTFWHGEDASRDDPVDGSIAPCPQKQGFPEQRDSGIPPRSAARPPCEPPSTESEPLRPSVLNPGRLIQALADTFRPAATRRGVELKVEPCRDWHDVIGDEPKLRHALSSLLAEALARRTAGWLRLSVKPPDGQHWSVVIEGAGGGLTPLAAESASRENGHLAGNGPSLAACERLAERMGGTLSLGPESSDRVRTEIRLPVMLREADAPAVADPAVLPPDPRPQPLHHQESSREKKSLGLLIVEDHEDLCDSLRIYFEGLGYRIRCASDAASAVRAAGEERFDVLVSDIALPDGDGWELLQSLEQRGHRPPYAIAMSGYYGASSYAKSREAGYAVHLTKPFAPDALEKALAMAERESPARA